MAEGRVDLSERNAQTREAEQRMVLNIIKAVKNNETEISKEALLDGVQNSEDDRFVRGVVSLIGNDGAKMVDNSNHGRKRTNFKILPGWSIEELEDYAEKPPLTNDQSLSR